MNEKIERVNIIGGKTYGLTDIATRQELIDETTRAKAAEEELEVQIAAEAARATAADRANAEAVIAEKERAEAALTAEVEKIKDGDTIVGQAREIHSRNGKNDSANFLVRTTAGSGTIGDGVATLKSVGGNIVKNLVDGTFASGWAQYGSNVTIDIANNVLHVVAGKALVGIGYALSGVTGAKYIIGCFIKANSGTAEIIFGTSIQKSTNSNEWKFVYSTGAFNSASAMYIRSKDDAADFYATKPILIKLTEMFGAGKEPTQAECDRLFGTMDALPQGLSIANPTVFKSTGFNQFNPEMVLVNRVIKTIDDEGNAIAPTIDDGDKTLAIIPCLPCKIGEGENNGYHIHGEFGNDIKVYLTPLNPKDVDGELYMHELSLSEKGTYVPQIKGYMIVEVPTTANLCAHFLWSEDCDKNAYEPYYESVVELPHIPEMSEYGLAGIQSSGTPACDEIDLVKGVYRKKIGCVTTDNANWKKLSGSSDKNIYYIKLDDLFIPNSWDYLSSIVCDRYNTVKTNDASLLADKSIMTNANSPNHYIYIRDDSFATLADMKSQLGNMKIYYRLAEPIEYPLPKVNNNYTSSDYGVEQFDGGVPCNANNLYYMRSLAGETRNFLDKMYANAGKESGKDVADYITNGIEGNKELATNAPNLALRALFVAAGAEYNDTDNHIVKDTPWKTLVDSVDYKAQWNLDVVTGSIQTLTYGSKAYEYVDDNGTWKIVARVGDKLIWDDTKVIHRKGYYYFNGLGDITEEQMLEIHDAGRIRFINADTIYVGRTKLITTLRSYTSGGEAAGISFYYGCNGAKLKVFMLKQSGQIWLNKISWAFSSCTNLRYIYPILNQSFISSSANASNPFANCSNLVCCHLSTLKVNMDMKYSPLLSKKSILYTIQNAAPTSAITITIHADAYARLKDDADIVAALAAQPLVTLVSA